MTTGDRAKMFSSHLSSTPKIENSGISGHFCSGVKCSICHPNDLFKRMSDNIDAQNRLALESGTLPPEEEALIHENLYPEEILHERTLQSRHDKKLVVMGAGAKISIASRIGQNVMIPEPELDPEPEAIEPEFTPKQKRPPSRLVQALMDRIEPTQHLWYKDYLK